MSAEPADADNFCVIIPAFMEERRIGDIVMRVRKYAANVVVVDDGSRDATAREAEAAGATVLRHPSNLGKGVALNTGFGYARAHGYRFVITMDANNQHDPADILRFRDAFERTRIPVLVGNRMAHAETVAPMRRLTNWIMSWLLCREMGQYLPDTQCGFRLYRCDVIPFISAEAERYAAESEILLRVAARGIRMDSLPIAPGSGQTHSRFRLVQDTVGFFVMLWRYRLRRRRLHARPRGFSLEPRL